MDSLAFDGPFSLSKYFVFTVLAPCICRFLPCLNVPLWIVPAYVSSALACAADPCLKILRWLRVSIHQIQMSSVLL